MPETTKRKRLPRFKSLDEEAEFWGTHSPLDYGIEFKEVQIKAVRPLQHAIELDIDKPLLQALIAHARASGVRLDALVCRWIAEGLQREAAAPVAKSETAKGKTRRTA